MATSIGSLLWVSGIDNTGLRRDATQASHLIDGISRTATGATSQLKSMAGALGLVAGGAGLVSLGRQVIEVRGQFQQLGIAFETMLNSKEKADKLLNDAVTFAAKTPFTLSDVATNIKQLIAMGIATENVMDTIKSLGDVAAGVSVPISRIAINYGQVAVLGKLQTRELRDFALAGIPLTQALADSLGRSKKEIQEMVEAGKIGFPLVEAAFKSMSSEGGQFYDLMEKQNASVTGQISNLTDKWEVMLNEIGKGNEGLIYGGINGLAVVISNYQGVLDVLKSLVVTYGAYKAALILTNISQTVSTSLGVYDIATKELQIGATIKATLAQSALNKAIMANPYVFAIAAIAGIGTALYLFSGKAKTTEELVSELNDSIGAIGEQLELDSAINRFDELKKTVEKTKKEQDEFNGLISKLSALYPEAINKTDQYGNAIDLVTDKLVTQNETVKEALRLGAESVKSDTKAALILKQYELQKLSLEQTTGKTRANTDIGGDILRSVQGTEDSELTKAQFDKNRDRIVQLRKEISELGGKINDADNELLKLGTTAADEFIKKHSKLFRDVNNLTRDEAIYSRKELQDLFESSNKNEQDAITARTTKLDEYISKIKTTREEIDQWVKDLAVAEAKLIELQNPDYESKTGTPGQEIKDQEAAIKELRDKLGLDDKSTKEAKKLYQERLDYESEIGRKRIDAQLEIEQALLNVREDSADKLRDQAELDYKKTLNDIASREAEQIKEYRKIYGDSATLPDADRDILAEQVSTAEKVKTDTIEQINKDAAEKLKAIWKKVTDERLSSLEAEKEAVKDKYAKELKEAIKLKDTNLVSAVQKNIVNETEAAIRKAKLEELDFTEEIEYRKNEIKVSGFDKEFKLQKLNFETFKRFQQQKIAILRATNDAESNKQADLLETALGAASNQNAVDQANNIANSFYDAAGYATDLANALGDGNSGISEMLKGVAGIANSIGDLSSKGAFSKEGMNTGDSVSSAISGATQLIGIVVSQAAKNKKEMRDYYDSIISQQQDYNLALNEQLRLNEEINGSIFFNDFSETLSDSAKALSDANDERDKAMAKFWSSEAIVGKKSVVSGGNVLGGVGAGAVLGASIGSIVPVIGTAIGAVVGAVVGGIVGLFAKKKKDIVAPLLETYPDLIKANGKFNLELAKTLVENDKVTKSTKKILENVIEWEEAAKKARDQIKGVIQDLAGSIGTDLRNALVEAFENGTDASIKFGESVKGVIEDIVSQQLFNAIFGQALKKLEDDLLLSSGVGADGDAVTGAGVDGDWIDDILRFYDKLPELTDSFNQAMGAVQVPEFDLFNGSTSNNTKLSSTNQIQRALTEDTGSAIMGLWRRSLDEQKTHSTILTRSNLLLFEISANTLRTANNTDKLDAAIIELKDIRENTRKSYLNDMGL